MNVITHYDLMIEENYAGIVYVLRYYCKNAE